LETEASNSRGERGRKAFEPRRTYPVEAVIVEAADQPVRVRIAQKAKHLRELGMSDRAIARALGFSDKTVAKAAGRAGALAPGMSQSEDSDD
jgi:hypothetical protein